jgi:hypothetical protein
MGLLIKVPLLVGCLMLLINTKNALLCAAVWGVAVLVLAVLFSTAFHLGVLLWGGISFLVALGYFSLLNYLEGKGWWWVAMPVGIIVLMLV